MARCDNIGQCRPKACPHGPAGAETDLGFVWGSLGPGISRAPTYPRTSTGVQDARGQGCGGLSARMACDSGSPERPDRPLQADSLMPHSF